MLISEFFQIQILYLQDVFIFQILLEFFHVMNMKGSQNIFELI